MGGLSAVFPGCGRSESEILFPSVQDFVNIAALKWTQWFLTVSNAVFLKWLKIMSFLFSWKILSQLELIACDQSIYQTGWNSFGISNSGIGKAKWSKEQSQWNLCFLVQNMGAEREKGMGGGRSYSYLNLAMVYNSRHWAQAYQRWMCNATACGKQDFKDSVKGK